jgi:hypothetical protein
MPARASPRPCEDAPPGCERESDPCLPIVQAFGAPNSEGGGGVISGSRSVYLDVCIKPANWEVPGSAHGLWLSCNACNEYVSPVGRGNRLQLSFLRLGSYRGAAQLGSPQHTS